MDKMKKDIQYLINKDAEGDKWDENDINLLEYYSNLKIPDIMYFYGQYIFYNINTEEAYNKAVNLIIESEKLGSFNSTFLINLILQTNLESDYNDKNDRYTLFKNKWKSEYLKILDHIKN
jgi:hypothetical protein